jgi:hypothetical protein
MFTDARQSKKVKYSLTRTEMAQLRKVCKYCSLPVAAMAARPTVARDLIAKHLSKA